VVASKLPPLDELVINGETGFLVDALDIDAWQDALFKLCTDKILFESMSATSQKWCRTKFALEVQVSDLQKVYDKLL
ncbi:glycosyltransferase, partial [Candidatus Babeliales bacterium]|nr:glycosyltransferase [Candidatus Babeliales bacterium]